MLDGAAFDVHIVDVDGNMSVFLSSLETLINDRHLQLRSYLDDWMHNEREEISHLVREHEQNEGHIACGLVPLPQENGHTGVSSKAHAWSDANMPDVDIPVETLARHPRKAHAWSDASMPDVDIPMETVARPPPFITPKDRLRHTEHTEINPLSDIRVRNVSLDELGDLVFSEFPERISHEELQPHEASANAGDILPFKSVRIVGRTSGTASASSASAPSSYESAAFTRGRHTESDSKKSEGAQKKGNAYGSKRRVMATLTENDKEKKMLARNRAFTNHEASMVDMPSRISKAKHSVRRVAFNMVASKYFEAFFAVVIIVNSLFVGVQLEYMAHARGDQQPDEEDDEPLVFFICQNVFSFLFLVEFVVRWTAEGRRFFYSMWTYLDMLVVGSSVVEVVLQAYNMGTQSFGGVGNLRMMRVLRITRLARIIRMIKIVRFVYALRAMLTSIISTLRSLFWAMLLLLMIIYLYGMIFAQIVDEKLKDGTPTLELEKLNMYWGSLSKSVFTLFKSVSGGVSWEEATYALSDVHGSLVALFLVYFIFVYFAVLNVVTGVFCQSAIESAQRDYDLVVQANLADKEVYSQKLKQLFHDIDDNQSGEVDIREFETHLKDESVQAYLTSLELNSTDIWRLFKLLDQNDSQVIDLDEFLTGCFKLRGPAKAIEMAEVMYEMRHTRQRLFAFIDSVSIALTSLLQLNGLDTQYLHEAIHMFSAEGSLGSGSNSKSIGPHSTQDKIRHYAHASLAGTHQSLAASSLENVTRSKRLGGSLLARDSQMLSAAGASQESRPSMGGSLLAIDSHVLQAKVEHLRNPGHDVAASRSFLKLGSALSEIADHSFVLQTSRETSVDVEGTESGVIEVRHTGSPSQLTSSTQESTAVVQHKTDIDG